MENSNDMLPDVISGAYDAILDPSHWDDTLALAAQFVGGVAASLFSKDAASKTGSVAYSYGIDPHYTQLYFDKYVKLDPATTGHLLAEIEEPVATADFIPYEEFLETRFYREWARPQGLVDFVSCVLDKSTTGAALFGVFRHEDDGVVDDEARDRMRRISPHIRRAVTIGRVVAASQAEAATFSDVFDGLSAGMLLVDESRRIIHANAAGRRLLATDDFLVASHGRLLARDGSIEKALRSALIAAGNGRLSAGTGSIAVPPVAEDRERHIVHVLPLTSAASRRAGFGSAPVAALFVHKAGIDVPSLPESIARHFNLTPTELRVLLAIVDVGGGPEVAEALGVADSTVKTHLHRLFRKTGTRRQTDLVKLVAGFSSPLLS